MCIRDRLWEVQQAVQQTGLAAQCRGRGAEVLAALQAETPAGLEKARKALNGRFAAELYGEGEMTLVHAAVQALETHHRLLVCLSLIHIFTRTGRKTTPNNRKQAMVPVNGHKITNNHGTAPGAWFEQDGHCAVPVSYTHLDVYKRQATTRPQSSRRLSSSART